MRPESLIWIFGHGRSGTSWLARMMAELPRHGLWNEPLVGELFGDFFHRKRGADRGRAFFLAPGQREVWARGIRALVLDGAAARKPNLHPEGHLVVKEPHGSIGAPLLSAALPESRLVLMVRDPRDMVASAIDGHRDGSWISRNPMIARTAERQGAEAWHPAAALYRKGFEEQMQLVADDVDAFVRYRAELLLVNVERALEAYREHPGPRALIRYEDLRADPLREMRRLYDELGIEMSRERLAAAVKAHDWSRLPDAEKGEGKKFRRASPGGWRDDLTPAQARAVEEIAAPILSAFYPD